MSLTSLKPLGTTVGKGLEAERSRQHISIKRGTRREGEVRRRVGTKQSEIRETR